MRRREKSNRASGGALARSLCVLRRADCGSHRAAVHWQSRVVLLPVLGLCMAAGRVDAAGGLSMQLALVPSNGTISAYEPLIAQVRLTNEGREDQVVSMGNSEKPSLYLEVRKSSGDVVAATPRPDADQGGWLSVTTIPPGETWSHYWVVTGLYQFVAPGEYVLHMRDQPAGRGGKVYAEAVARVRVEPFDAQRLEARCEQLFQPIRENRSSKTDLPLAARGKALYSVRHDIVLPYLDWMAREWGDRYACRAIKRIGTPRAKALYEALAARNDRVGKAARRVPKMQMPDITMWDVVCE
jgi:hypothetical protein